MSTRISRTMQRGLQLAHDKGLHRLPGGYWVPADQGPKDSYSPFDYVGVQTVRALESRGLLEPDVLDVAPEWRQRRVITDDGRDALAASKGAS